MGSYMPQWLVTSFVRSVKSIGASAPIVEIESIVSNLAKKLQDISREYHDINHIAFMLTKIDELADSAHNSDCLRIAAWYHGVFYNSYLGGFCPALVDEDPIALIKSDLSSVGVDSEISDYIANIVKASSKYSVTSSDDIDTQILFDCSIAIFAGTPQEYRHYLKLARKEYSDVSTCFVLSARKRFITKLLSRSKIFVSPLGQNWEILAKQNLEAELVRINSELSNLAEEELVDISNHDNDDEMPCCELKDTILIKRVSVAEKLSKVKKIASSHSSLSTSGLNVISQTSMTHSITKINDLTSSLEMVEDCFDSNNCDEKSNVANIEFE